MKKSDPLAEALGAVDELNCWVGVCRVSIEDSEVVEVLHGVQDMLLTIGSSMAGSGLEIEPGETEKLETLIDTWTEQLPKLSSFIFPTGKGGAAHLQVARTVCRRAERAVVNAGVTDTAILTYINRLSDALFTMARKVNHGAGGVEEPWKK